MQMQIMAENVDGHAPMEIGGDTVYEHIFLYHI